MGISRTAKRDGLHTEFYSVSPMLYNCYSSIVNITSNILLKIDHREKFDANLWIWIKNYNKKIVVLVGYSLFSLSILFQSKYLGIDTVGSR